MTDMHVIYVGDSGNVTKRIRPDHCRGGDVEGSALRERIAERKRYPIKKTKRLSGSEQKRLDLPDPRVGEREITLYVKSGKWRYVVCAPNEEARDFQWR